jgi:hypothetical protein
MLKAGTDWNGVMPTVKIHSKDRTDVPPLAAGVSIIMMTTIATI